MEKDSLILYSKTEALFFEVYPALKNFPKIEKQGICLEFKRTFIGLLESISLAKEVPSKRKEALQSAAARTRNLVTLFRLSRNNRYIGIEFFKHIDLKITEIKKILAGFLKSTRRPRHAP